jgi:hypothetical protein
MSSICVHTEGYTYLGCKRSNLSPSLHSQVRAHDSTNTRPKHFTLVVQQNSRVVVEFHIAAIWTANHFGGANDDSASDVSSSHFRSGGRLTECHRHWSRAFYDADNLITHRAPSVVDFVLENVDTLNQQCTGVVDDLAYMSLERVFKERVNACIH